MKLTLPSKRYLLNRQITFPHDALCFAVIEGSALFSYEFRCVDTDTHYSDKPILCEDKKELLPFSSYRGRVFSFDFDNKSDEENHIILNVRFEDQRLSTKDQWFREYTLDGLYVKFPIKIDEYGEAEVLLTNFRGGHYVIHQIYSPLYKHLSCKIEYHGKIFERFHLENVYRFKKPWILRWPDSAKIYLKNGVSSKLEIQPNEIYFAGYLLKPIKVLQAIAPLNARNSFLIEGIVA